jgi:hypothetical protein
VDDVWLGLKKNNNVFKWTDGSDVKIYDWAKGNPSNKTDHNSFTSKLEIVLKLKVSKILYFRI